MKRDPRTKPTAGRTLDHAASFYDTLAPLMLLGHEARLNRCILTALDLQPNITVLDVGCGTGVLTQMIADRSRDCPGLSVLGIDAAARMIDVARKRAYGYTNLTFETEMAEALPFDDDRFDCVVSSLFFHHVDFRTKLASINEIERVLTPGGQALILDVDIPTTWFGRICAWSGYLLFRQAEIRENIEGRLREAFDRSRFPAWHLCSHHGGYLSLFELRK